MCYTPLSESYKIEENTASHDNMVTVSEEAVFAYITALQEN
jgi:hypothetical protein